MCFTFILYFFICRPDKFFHKFMNSCHFIYAPHIYTAEYKSVIYVSIYGIDKCFCYTIWHFVRITLFHAVVTFVHRLFFFFNTLYKIISYRTPRHTDRTFDYFYIILLCIKICLLIFVRCIALFCRNKTARYLYSVCPKFKCMDNVVMVKYPTSNDNRYMCIIFFTVLFGTFDNLFYLLVIINIFNICEFFI